MRVQALAASAAALFVFAMPALAQYDFYRIQSAGTSGPPVILARGISDQKQVVGQTNVVPNPYQQSFSWTIAGGTNPLPTLVNQLGGVAHDVNASGLIVGFGNGGLQKAYAYDSTTSSYITLNGSGNTAAHAVNQSGSIVGSVGTSAARWATPSSNVTLLSAPSGATSTFAFDINNAQTVVGSSTFTTPDPNNPDVDRTYTQATFWDASNAPTVLSDVLSGRTGYQSLQATSINASGLVGVNNIDGGYSFFWDTAANTVSPFLVGFTIEAVNDSGMAVGQLNGRATLWDNGVFTDLNTLVPSGSGTWNLQFASDINNLGSITGWGTRNGITESYALIVPAPGAATLLGVGGLLATRRRRS